MQKPSVLKSLSKPEVNQPEPKRRIIIKHSGLPEISVIKLKRTDTTLDLSQKAKRRWGRQEARKQAFYRFGGVEGRRRFKISGGVLNTKFVQERRNFADPSGEI